MAKLIQIVKGFEGINPIPGFEFLDNEDSFCKTQDFPVLDFYTYELSSKNVGKDFVRQSALKYLDSVSLVYQKESKEAFLDNVERAEINVHYSNKALLEISSKETILKHIDHSKMNQGIRDIYFSKDE